MENNRHVTVTVVTPCLLRLDSEGTHEIGPLNPMYLEVKDYAFVKVDEYDTLLKYMDWRTDGMTLEELADKTPWYTKLFRRVLWKLLP